MIKTDRNVFIGGHVTQAVKTALDMIAKARRVSLSYLIFSILSSSPEVKPLLDDTKENK